MKTVTSVSTCIRRGRRTGLGAPHFRAFFVRYPRKSRDIHPPAALCNVTTSFAMLILFN